MNIKKTFNQRGSALIIAVLIIFLLTAFIHAMLVDVTSSAVIAYNDAKLKQAYYLACGAIEKMCSSFTSMLYKTTKPDATQILDIKNSKLDIPNDPNDPNKKIIVAEVTQDIKSNLSSQDVVLEDGPYAGLNAKQTSYEFIATTTINTNISVSVSKSLYQYMIPIFQFGIFSTRDLEFYSGYPFIIKGRFHANKNCYFSPNRKSSLIFNDRITCSGEIITDVLRNNVTRSSESITITEPITLMQIKLKGTGDTYVGSGSVIGGPEKDNNPTGEPAGKGPNPYFSTLIKATHGQVLVHTPPLNLPVQNAGGLPIELIRRGLPDEDPQTSVVASARYFYKPGIRITLSDTQVQLPKDTHGEHGGIQLDTTVDLNKVGFPLYIDNRRGYIPMPLGNYKASRVNGYRLKGWLKVETVSVKDGKVITTDISKFILALGVTKYDPNDINKLRIAYDPELPYGKSNIPDADSLSIIRLQTPSLPGGNVSSKNGKLSGSNNYLVYDKTIPNLISADENDTPAILWPNKLDKKQLIAYPISIYDRREGYYLDLVNNANIDNNTVTAVDLCGLFSLVDIDLNNLKRLIAGEFDYLFSQAGVDFSSQSIPFGQDGIVLYVSDRRGDSYSPASLNTKTTLHDGKYDVESVYGPNYLPPKGQTLHPPEDTNDNGIIENDVMGEGAAYNESIDIIDAITKGSWHPNQSIDGLLRYVDLNNSPKAVFRRAVRLSNGSDLSTSASSSGTCTHKVNELCESRGLTIATENPIYVQGNFNTTGVLNPKAALTNPTDYQGREIPVSIACDAITLLSNSWKDFASFTKAYNRLGRAKASDTAYRFVVITGRVRSSIFIGNNDDEPWGIRGKTGQVGVDYEENDVRLYGGVQNLLRYLENWEGRRSSFSGSIVDGWDSWQANAPIKVDYVYGQPIRDYIFNPKMLDIDKLPPATPNLSYTVFGQPVQKTIVKK